MEQTPHFVAFAEGKLLAEGSAPEVLPVLKARFDRTPDEQVLTFDRQSGRAVDFDLSGTLDDVLGRLRPARGPGRPKLGVTSREIALLPRHWAWLEQQPSGASAALRRLVEEAMKRAPGREQARLMRASLSNMLTALAGDRPHYEEVTRALYADDLARLEELVAAWPCDLRDYALREARAAAEAERTALARA